jgi:RNA 2',3'-cyclic 3'-phosphodiesterase
VATDRLFLALRPDALTAGRIHDFTLDLSQKHGLAGRPMAVNRLHVTLCFLGEHDGLAPSLVSAADDAARSLRGVPFELAFDRVMSFPRPGDAPVVLCRKDTCAPLARLRAALCETLGRTSCFELETRGFKPHVTLLYDRRPVPLQKIAPIAWMVTEVLLIRSLIGHGEHEVLGRYPLR